MGVLMGTGAGIQAVQAVFLLLLVCVAVFAGLARRLKVPYPILLVIAGLVLSFLPGMPRIGLNPSLVFFVFLPPLLYSAAWTLSWREFQRNFVSIAMLAVGLVFFTVLGLAMAAGRLLPGFDWKSAVLLGAVVAATDAIAATSIARRVGLPQRIVDILEAESLVNDGTGLLALQFGLLMLVTGRTPSVVEGVGRLVFLTGGGVLVGLAIGGVVAWFERWVDDGPVEIVISILVPYTTYLVGDRAHVSGVIAVIACSMYMSRQSPEFMSPQVRLQTTAVWDALTFVLNGIVFVLIGLQLPYVMGQIGGMSRAVLLEYGVGFSAVMMIVRMAWVYGETYIAYAVRRWWLKVEVTRPEARSVFVIGWGGMRGVLSLAAAVSLPYTLPNGSHVSSAEHDHLSRLLSHRGNPGGTGVDPAVADSKAGVVGDGKGQLGGAGSASRATARGARSPVSAAEEGTRPLPDAWRVDFQLSAEIRCLAGGTGGAPTRDR